MTDEALKGLKTVVGLVSAVLALLISIAGVTNGMWKFNDLEKSLAAAREDIAEQRARLDRFGELKSGPVGQPGPAGPPGPKGDPGSMANVKALEDQVTALAREVAALKRQRSSAQALPAATVDARPLPTAGLSMPSNAKCFILAPNKTSQSFSPVKVGDFICDAQDRPFLRVDDYVDKGGRYWSIQDGTRQQRCFEEQDCDVSTPGVFAGAVRLGVVGTGAFAVFITTR